MRIKQNKMHSGLNLRSNEYAVHEHKAMAKSERTVNYCLLGSALPAPEHPLVFVDDWCSIA
jgi:hypothetical protein